MVRTFVFTRELLSRPSDLWQFIHCTELRMFLSYQDEDLTYALVEPVARAMIWQRYKEIAAPQTFDLSPLREHGVMLAAFEITRDAEHREALNAALDLVEEHGSLLHKQGASELFAPYFIRTERNFDRLVMRKVCQFEPEVASMLAAP
jgi:hypothetical protein